MNTNSPVWILLSLAAAAGWGLQYVVIEHMLKGMKAIDLLTYYFIGGAVLCCLYSFAYTGTLPVPQKGEVAPLLIVIGSGLFAMLAITGAIWGKNSTQASLLENAVPIFTFILSGLLFGQWDMTLRTFFGAGFIFAGIALVSYR